MNVLAIDTSTHVMGIALSKKGKLVGELTTNLEKNHSVRLMPAINYLMSEVDMKAEDLNKIVVSKGPGSYTGVRIGLSTAKSMAWALGIPIIGVSSLEQLAFQGRNSSKLIVPFIDARRQSIFTGLYRFQEGKISLLVDERYVKMKDWLGFLKEKKEDLIFVSPDLATYKDEILAELGEYAKIPNASYQLGKPSDLLEAALDKKADEVHILTPNYLRITEAESNLIKSKQRKKEHE